MKSENKKIALLPDYIANRIAAGEVIERPASLVKELVENSIDANAKNITIDIEEGGKNSITIIDDGDGIAFDELPLAVAHHATSKIKTIEDLDSIYTLGFRGEALASVSDVSRLEIKSKSIDEDRGGIITIEGGIIKTHAPSPLAKGTSITVNNLFYNLPARYKFLKHPSREFLAIKEVFDSFVLSNYKIAFSLFNNKKSVCVYKKKENMLGRLKDFYGETANHFVEIKLYRDGIKIYGYVSNMHIMRPNRKDMYIFLNGRIIENKTVVFAIKNAYKGIIPGDKFPYAFIHIEIERDKVDVNVHPSKKEVKIKEEREIASLIYNGVIENVGKASLFSSKNTSGIKETEDKVFSIPQNEYEEHNDKFYNYTTDYSIKDKLYAGENIRQDTHTDSINIDENRNKNAAEREVFGEGTKIIGQIFASYIVAQRGKEILIIDQHAAYERLNYEIILKKIKSEKIEYESLMIAFELRYKEYEADIIMSAKEMFNKIGIYPERKAKDIISVDKIPIYLKNMKQNESIIKECFDSFIAEDKNIKDIDKFIGKYIETVACKYSPKANDSLARESMENLIYMLEKENILVSCPHGRPFVIKMDKEYLDKKFFRY